MTSAFNRLTDEQIKTIEQKKYVFDEFVDEINNEWCEALAEKLNVDVKDVHEIWNG